MYYYFVYIHVIVVNQIDQEQTCFHWSVSCFRRLYRTLMLLLHILTLSSVIATTTQHMKSVLIMRFALFTTVNCSQTPKTRDPSEGYIMIESFLGGQFSSFVQSNIQVLYKHQQTSQNTQLDFTEVSASIGTCKCIISKGQQGHFCTHFLKCELEFALSLQLSQETPQRKCYIGLFLRMV